MRPTPAPPPAAPGNPRRWLALVSGGEVLAAPIVREPIAGGELRISGPFSADHAKKIAASLPT